jgi:hypothetical protein
MEDTKVVSGKAKALTTGVHRGTTEERQRQRKDKKLKGFDLTQKVYDLLAPVFPL